jgi:hypothetical protein
MALGMDNGTDGFLSVVIDLDLVISLVLEVTVKGRIVLLDPVH